MYIKSMSLNFFFIKLAVRTTKKVGNHYYNPLYFQKNSTEFMMFEKHVYYNNTIFSRTVIQ